MKRSKSICCLLIPFLFGSELFISFLTSRALAQEKKQEEFGASLKRLKWDKDKAAAVDKKSGKEAAKSKAASDEDQDVIKIETSLVTFDLLVTDRQGYAIQGLTQEDFIVTENGSQQSISTFSRGDDAKLARSIILIFDYSGSQYPYLQLSLAAAKTLIAQLKPKDKMAIVTDDVALLQDFTNDKNHLNVALDKIEKRVFTDRKVGRSLQYSALFAVMQELLTEAERPIIIFQTDGDQWIFLRPWTERLPREPGRVNFGLTDVITATQRERVTIYAVIPGLQLIGFSPEEQTARAKQILRTRWSLASTQADIFLRDQKLVSNQTRILLRAQESLEKLVTATGGWFNFLEQPRQAAGIYEQILSDINRRYIIGYYPTNEAKDGSLRKVRFEVRGHPEYVILGRRNYYAPSEAQ